VSVNQMMNVHVLAVFIITGQRLTLAARIQVTCPRAPPPSPPGQHAYCGARSPMAWAISRPRYLVVRFGNNGDTKAVMATATRVSIDMSEALRLP